MWKWMGLFLRKNNFLRCWGLLSLLNWIGVVTLSPLLKLSTRKLEPWFILWSFFLLRLLCITINLPYDHVVMSELVLLIAIWNCWISYKNGYAGLLVLHLLPLLNPWLIIRMKPVKVFAIGITLVDVHLNWLNWSHFLILKGGLLITLIDWMVFLSPFLNVTKMSMSTISLLTQLDYGIICL